MVAAAGKNGPASAKNVQPSKSSDSDSSESDSDDSSDEENVNARLLIYV